MIQPKDKICGFYETKGSKFLGFLVPYEDFDIFLLQLKDQHPKACHFVTAFRTISHCIVEGYSDDGEPKGSAGMPILKVLRGEEIVNAGFIAVRYFGGTLLGVGGLVRAYTQIIQNTIVEAKKNQLLDNYRELIEWEIYIGYTLLNRAIYLCNQFSIIIKRKEFQSNGILLILQATLEEKRMFDTNFSPL